jgi:hypothetical protein
MYECDVQICKHATIECYTVIRCLLYIGEESLEEKDVG